MYVYIYIYIYMYRCIHRHEHFRSGHVFRGQAEHTEEADSLRFATTCEVPPQYDIL